MEAASSESTEARQTVTVEYGKRLERIDGTRAQKQLPPPNAGTEARAFNASVMLPPNPTVTGNVIGSKHLSNLPFFYLYPSRWTKVRPDTV